MRTYAIVALLILLAGCIEMPQDGNVDAQTREPASGGSMTASETRTDKSELCTDLQLQGNDRFCAERVVTIEGTVAGFPLLDVDLQTFNGEILVSDSNGDAWKAVVTLRGRGSNAAAASAAIDDIDFAWAHEDAAGHFVDIAARYNGKTDGRSAAIVLEMPRGLVMRLAATTSNGDVTVDSARTDGLALTTSNGKINAHADVTQVLLTTSNGKIDADLRPGGSGRWTITTSNGAIVLKVPEGSAFGYSMEATTSNGDVDYTLRDGDEGPCPQGSQYYTPPCNHRTFETRNKSARDHAVSATLSTSNGDIDVGPA